MKDSEFIDWMRARLVSVYKENELTDFVHKMKEVSDFLRKIESIPGLKKKIENNEL